MRILLHGATQAEQRELCRLQILVDSALELVPLSLLLSVGH